MHYYSTMNGIVLTHSSIIEDGIMDIVNVKFERTNKKGFDFAEAKICNEYRQSQSI